MRALGLDIGGANVKLADATGRAMSIPFALWKQPAALPDVLKAALGETEPHDILAVTMTGELCDCFTTKRDGVRHILEAVASVAGDSDVLVWQTDGRFVSPETACERILQTAAANWHALATFAAKLISPAIGLLIDIGSTTTDIIPLRDDRPVPQGATDTERLATGELVYTGVGRTPICAVATQLDHQGRPHRVAAEFFATMRDAYLLAGDVDENPEDADTADGRPATRPCAAARIARMIGADTEQLGRGDTEHLARQMINAQESLVADAVRQVTSGLDDPIETAIISGSGEFLAARIAGRSLGPEVPIISFRDRFGRDVSRAACAFALAHLAHEDEWADHG